MPPALFFLLRIALAILGFLWFCIHFRIICSSSVKTFMGNLIGWYDPLFVGIYMHIEKSFEGYTSKY